VQFLPWNGDLFEKAVALLRNMAGCERNAGCLYENVYKKRMKKKERSK